jgi:apolipoprotein N-acyltransferase
MFSKKDIIRYLFLIVGLAGVSIYMGDWQVAIAAWIAPIFLLRFLRNSRFLGFLFAFIGFGIVSSVVQNGILPTEELAPKILTVIRFAIIFSIPFIIDRLLYKQKSQFLLTLIYPTTLVLLEYLFSISPFGTWGILPHTQLDFPVLLQMSTLTGLFGITFIVAWFASVINWIWEHEFSIESLRSGGVIYASILISFLLYGGIKLTFYPAELKTVKVAGISGSTNIFYIIPDAENAKKYVSTKEEIEEQIQLTRDAVREGAKIIVWHEGALVLDSKNIFELTNRMKQIADAYDAFIAMSYLELSVRENEKPFNNKTILLNKDGETVWEYKKSKLAPGPETEATNAGDSKLPYVDTKYGRLGTAICFDMEFPRLINQAGRKQIDIFIVPGCDWKGITPIHTKMAKLEAIQNSFNLVRITSPGLSVAYNYNGEVIAKKDTYHTSDKIMYADVPVFAPDTLYSRAGNIFIWICILASIAFLIWKFLILPRK